jgi:hypothetical protein
MGYDAACTLTTDGQSFRGIARLEHKELIFRGDTRLVIPLAAIDEVQARDGSLVVTFGGRQAVLSIGPDALKWVQRITHPPSRLAKLGVKEGMRIAVIDVEDEALGRELASCKAVIDKSGRRGDLDLIFVGMRNARDLARLGGLSTRIKPAGAIWLIRVKGLAATVTETESMAAGKRAGLVDVKVVSFSDTHSAEKYVIPVAKRGRSSRSSSTREDL